jgi:formyltetrahydrofolate-dependent phosphoribosylglycinamide formyltransferase
VKNLAVFASGRGSNFQKIFHKIQDGAIPAQVKCLISDNKNAGALDFARSHSVKCYVVVPKEYPDSTSFGEALLNILAGEKIDWVVLAGYLKKIPDNVVSAYANRILNIHPALLPAFGGRGMYGMNVHRAVFASGAKVSGVTVHLVNSVYDAGPVVMQKAVDIEECRSPEEIAEKVLKEEHQLYSEAIIKLLTCDFNISGNRVVFS